LLSSLLTKQDGFGLNQGVAEKTVEENRKVTAAESFARRQMSNCAKILKDTVFQS
jgi:hypothetical protein